MSKSNYGFGQILGQGKNIDLVLQEVKQGSLAHALLFTGPEGSGRKSLAMALAKYLLCENPAEGDACHTCPACRYFEAGSHPDFRGITSPDHKLIKVERVRQEVIADLPHLPQLAKYKVYLIEADFLNEQGQNALLKSLEEPPSYAYFLLTAKSRDQLLATVNSRVREYKLAPLSQAELVELLQARGYESNLSFVASFADHLGGKALDLAEDKGFGDLRQEALDLLSQLPTLSYFDLTQNGQAWLANNKDDFLEILALWQAYLRDLGLVLVGKTSLGQKASEAENLLNFDQVTQLEHISQDILLKAKSGDSYQALLGLNQAEACLREAQSGLDANVNFEILSWNLLLGLKDALGPAV